DRCSRLGQEVRADLDAEGLRLRLRERLEHERVDVRARSEPRRLALDEIGAREAEQEDGRVTDPAREVLDQVEEGRLGPVDVLEADDEGARPGERLEQLADRPERPLPGRARPGAA